MPKCPGVVRGDGEASCRFGAMPQCLGVIRGDWEASSEQGLGVPASSGATCELVAVLWKFLGIRPGEA